MEPGKFDRTSKNFTNQDSVTPKKLNEDLDVDNFMDKTMLEYSLSLSRIGIAFSLRDAQVLKVFFLSKSFWRLGRILTGTPKRSLEDFVVQDFGFESMLDHSPSRLIVRSCHSSRRCPRFGRFFRKNSTGLPRIFDGDTETIPRRQVSNYFCAWWLTGGWRCPRKSF